MTASVPDRRPASAGPEFASFVVNQLDSEEKRRASLEVRGLAVITTSGTLVTILLAFAALITQQKDYRLPEFVGGWLTTSLLAFVLAAALAIGANAPQLYRVVDVAELKDVVKARWEWSSDDALKTLTATRLDELQHAQSMNGVKGYLLLGAAISQGVAIAGLTIAVAIILGQEGG